MVKGKKEDKTALQDPGNILFILYVGFVVGVIFLALVVDSRATASSRDRDQFPLAELRQGAMTFAGTEEKN